MSANKNLSKLALKVNTSGEVTDAGLETTFVSNSYFQNTEQPLLVSNGYFNVTYTAADVLTKIKTVDGANSGLDADTVDGFSGSYLRNASNINAGTLSADRLSGTYSINISGSSDTVDGLEATDLTSNNYVQDRYTSNSFVKDTFTTNNYIQGTYVSNNYVQDRYTSNSFVKDTFTTNNYIQGTYVSNNYVQDRYTSNNFVLTRFGLRATNTYVQDTFTSNNYIQSSFVGINSDKVGIGTSSPLTNLEIANNTPSINLHDTDHTADHNTSSLLRNNDTFAIQTRTSTNGFVSNDYIIATSSSGATSHRWTINNSELMRLDSSGIGIGTTTPNTLIQIAGGIAAGSIRTATGSTTWDVSTHQSLKVTASGSTTVTISNASSTPIGAGFTLIVQDASSASLTLSASPTPKYAGGVAPSLNGTAGEYLIVGLIHVGSGQLLVSYVSLK